jgi:hypothetical protein
MTELERLKQRNQELAETNRRMFKELVEMRKRLKDAEELNDQLTRELNDQ